MRTSPLRPVYAVFMVIALLAVLLPPPPNATARFTVSDETVDEACPTACSSYDVVVIGSEIEGVLLARAAHDLGKNVLILDPRPKPGGELIQGQMMVLDEPHDAMNRSLVQGELKKLYDGYKQRRIRTVGEFESYFDQLLKPVPIRSGIQIEDVQTAERADGRTLRSLTYRMPDGEKQTVTADYWVENTDFAALTGRLGVKRIPGTESLFLGGGSKPEYMAATYMLRFKNVNWRELQRATVKDYPISKLDKDEGPNTYVDKDFGTGFSTITAKYRPSDPQLRLRGINSTYQKKGKVIMNALLIFDVDPSDPASVSSAVEKGRNEAPRILEFLRNHLPGYENAQLDNLPDYLYIREFDRYEPAYLLKRDDLLGKRMFWDNVGIGGYPIDVQGTRRFPEGDSLGMTDRYGLPLRSFELKDIDNVLIVGKNAGAAADAYGSVRIMPNTGLAAQVIGILLGREKKPLRELNAADFKRIHEYLAKDYDIQVAE
ncbi:FAD-dependent oxidoreductase [Cohnella sp. AR92]|uniref:FAD-dependent oxidoreductase n=1 Tax=Cohnella sp. AR92 TaxID=648716 RepID=UPI001EE01BAB|nr:FAD-dependent oxidoreductase [Cohnella sp. AR92]